MQLNQFGDNTRDEMVSAAIHSSGLANTPPVGSHSERLAAERSFNRRREIDRRRTKVGSYNSAGVRFEYRQGALGARSAQATTQPDNAGNDSRPNSRIPEPPQRPAPPSTNVPRESIRPSFNPYD